MQQKLNSSSSEKMPPHQNDDHHLNQQQIPIYHHQQHDFESSTPHDDFLEHMISTFHNPTSNNSNWDHLPTNGPDSPPSTKSAMAMMMLQNQMMMMSRGGGVENVDDSVVQSLVNGFNGSGHMSNPNQNFHQNQTPSFGATSGVAVMNGAPANGSGGGAPTQPRQRVRARRGQATDPHSIAERLRRERIAERMKSLQELVPNANKTDKASMLDEIIDYVKFLQLQVKVLSMSRLGGAGAVAPLVANLSSQGGSDSVQGTNGAQTSSTNDNMTVTEHQVAKLMEQDMGSAMQYLQGKGLCLMPISLANAISSSTCNSRSHLISTATATATTNWEGSLSPTMSVLTVQSGNGDNGAVSEPL